MRWNLNFLLWLLFSPRGRINRAKYWVTNLAVLLVIGGPAAAMAYSILDHRLALVTALLLFLAWVCSSAAIGAKRFHDRARSGWWILFPAGPELILASGEVLQN